MTLNRAICKRCWKDDDPEERVGWHERDNKRWREERKVCCPFTHAQSVFEPMACVDEPPPRFCPYAAEHVVSQ